MNKAISDALKIQHENLHALSNAIAADLMKGIDGEFEHVTYGAAYILEEDGVVVTRSYMQDGKLKVELVEDWREPC